ncbi:MAG: ABC-ATPase domain-containing protein [Clostridiales bacterium]|nr:ABC-ATPase domain-containing protein [Clostridiales bacterium]
MDSLERIKLQIQRLDGQDYGAYQAIIGTYKYPKFNLYIDQIPKDPYAPPHTGIYRVRIPRATTGFSDDMTSPNIRRIALRDYLARMFYINCSKVSKGRRGTGNSGIITIAKPEQTILDRSSIVINDDYLEARFFIGLPASGRSITASIAETMLFDELPEIVRRTLFFDNLKSDSVYQHLKVAEDADSLRSQLESHNLIGFIRDGALLPRRSGIDNRPLKSDQVVVFQSPESMRVEFNLPNEGIVTGMGIKKGVTLIVGGGYHGKSTVLNALQLGIYNHIPGDGREFCVSVPNAVKVCASSGRYVANVDISPFLNNMPLQRDTTSFSTENASGSTSQAATIIESIEAGATVLLMDEDTCAANFMIRDKRMQELVPKTDEPITSFIDCIKSLYENRGISTILVMGGSGDYFDVADQVIQMKEFLPYDVTLKAHEIATVNPTGRVHELSKGFVELSKRVPYGDALSPLNEYQKLRISAPDVDKLIFGNNTVDLSDIGQLIENAQTKAIGLTINHVLSEMKGTRTIEEIIQEIMTALDIKGLDLIDEHRTGDLATFRSIELAAVLNRMRGLKVKKK